MHYSCGATAARETVVHSGRRWRRLVAALGATAALVAALSVALPAPAFAETTFFGGGAQLNSCDAISSPNGKFTLTMQCGGNLELSVQPENRVIWSSQTEGQPGSVLQMQADGNLVIYGPGHVAVWQTDTAGHTYATLGLQDDGNLVVIAPGNKPVWASNTIEAAISAPAPAAAGGTPNAPGPPAPTSYVALGDSYSAGEGLADFELGTDNVDNNCHRSDQAYSQLMSPPADRFVACSGAKLTAFTTQGAESPQEKALGPDVKLVTMTFGGNDLGWVDTLLSCIKIQREVLHSDIYSDENGCRAALDQTPAKIDALRPKLIELYEKTLQSAPNAQVRVLTYPPLFPLDPRDGGCRIGRFHPVQMVIANDVARQFGLYEQTANAAIMTAVQEVANKSADYGGRLRVVDIETQFGGYLESSHSISCGDTGRPKPWVNALRYSTSQAASIAVHLAERDIKQFMPDQLKHDLRDIITASFHPTKEGQRQMYLALQSTLSG